MGYQEISLKDVSRKKAYGTVFQPATKTIPPQFGPCKKDVIAIKIRLEKKFRISAVACFLLF